MARLDAVLQAMPAPRLRPARIRRDALAGHGLALEHSLAAGADRRVIDGQPSDRSGKRARQLRGVAILEIADLWIREQHARPQAGAQPRGRLGDGAQAPLERCAVGDQRQDFLLLPQQLIGALAVGDVVKIDGNAVRFDREHPHPEPAPPRRMEVLQLRHLAGLHGVHVGALQRRAPAIGCRSHPRNAGR